MSAVGIEQALAEARALRELAAGINLHSTGSAWRSPARDRCDARLDDLERQAQVIARKLELIHSFNAKKARWVGYRPDCPKRDMDLC